MLQRFFSGKTPESAQYTPDAVLSSIGPVSIKETVSINEIAVPLYPTFESPADALHNMLNNEAIDDSRDGDWDHVGYVVACGNGIMSEGYRDYHVAQHTPDYHLDVSDSKNHWETHNGKANYGMFRR